MNLSAFQDIKAIIFDLDGVLVDSRHLHYEALNKALAEVNPAYTIGVEEHLAKYDGLPTNKKLALLSKEKGLPTGFHTQIWKRKQDVTVDLIGEVIKPNLEQQRLLKELKRRGYKLFCASNSIALTLIEMLKSLGILDDFDRVYSNEDVLFPKPHPMIYMKCCCDNGLIPCQTLVIEDSPIGRVAATLSGCHVCPVACPAAVTIDVIEKSINIAQEKNKTLTIDTRWHADIQVVIPMAGLGSRFAVQGYQQPKPLIPVGPPGAEKPMIQWVVENLNISGAKFIFIVRTEHVQDTESTLKYIAPDCKIVATDKVTDGPACSVLLAHEQGVLDENKPLLIANSDQWLEWDPNAFLYQSQTVDGSISVFKQPNPFDKKWSYVCLNHQGMVDFTREKEVISDLASTGIYYWSKTGDFVKYARQMISANDRVNKEYYVCPVYNWAIKDGKKIKVVECKKMWGLGVPEDLNTFERDYLGIDLK